MNGFFNLRFEQPGPLFVKTICVSILVEYSLLSVFLKFDDLVYTGADYRYFAIFFKVATTQAQTIKLESFLFILFNLDLVINPVSTIFVNVV